MVFQGVYNRTLKKQSMNKILALFILIPLCIFGQEKSMAKSDYPNRVGDIEYNPETDKQDFELCYEKHIFQYYNTGEGLEYVGEKIAIEKIFKEKYKSDIISKETGLIRINFVVSCKGKTDRFRLIAMDENYNEKVFLKSITDQLLSITKNLNGWKVKKYGEESIDYYQYLIFKIKDGQLEEILP